MKLIVVDFFGFIRKRCSVFAKFRRKKLFVVVKKGKRFDKVEIETDIF